MNENRHQLCALLIASSLLCSASASAAPVAYWRFEEGAGQHAANEELATLDLTLERGTSGSGFADPAWEVDGFAGGALRYSNSTAPNYTVMTLETGETSNSVPPISAENLRSTTFTVEAFVRLDELPGAGFSSTTPFTIVELKNAGIAGSGLAINYNLRVRNTGSITTLEGVFTRSGGTSAVLHTIDLEEDVWYYVGFSRDAAGNTNLYLNDQVVTTTTPDPLVGDITQPFLSVGAEKTTSAWQRGFVGTIDELRISNTALAENELLYHTIPEPAVLAIGMAGLPLMYVRRRRS